jgi:hypothetical protein
MAIMLWTALLFVSNVALASPQGMPVGPSSATPDKPFHGVSDHDVLTAHCRRSEPLTTQEMIEWLNLQAQRQGVNDSPVPKADVFGIELVNETPYFVHLLEELLTNDALTGEPQKTYSSHCRQVLCTSQELFGDRVGVQLLFMLGRFGFNGSHVRVKNAAAWTSEELDVVLLSLSDLPAHLSVRDSTAMNHPLVHFKRTDDSSDRPLANAVIYVFNVWNQQTPSLQRYSLFHELGHNMGFDFGFDSLRAWYQAADWIESDIAWTTPHPERKISQYAETNPDEDFAESFSAYRYNPEGLKKVSPKIYQFMKKKVFRDLEYTSVTACLSKPPEMLIRPLSAN